MGWDLHCVSCSEFRYKNENVAFDENMGQWCFDLYPFVPNLIPLGFATEFSSEYGVLLKDRSGLSSKGIHVLGGVIDSGYRGEWKVCLINLSAKVHRIYEGDRIAQAVIVRNYYPKWEEVKELEKSERGSKGYGSSGK